MKRKLIQYSLLGVLLFSLPLLTTSCSSSDDDANYGEGEGLVRVTLAQSSFDTAVTRAEVAPQTQIIDLGDGLKLKATLAPDNDAATRAYAETKDLGDGVYYRLVIFDAAGKVKGSEVYKRGTEADEDVEPIPVPAGTGYKYIAYSVNTTVESDLPAFTGATYDDFTVTATCPQDFMMAVSTETFAVTANATTRLTLNFMHELASVQININASADGVDGNITAVQGVSFINATNVVFKAASKTPSSTDEDKVFNFGTFTPAKTVSSQRNIVYPIHTQDTQDQEKPGRNELKIDALTIGSKTKEDIKLPFFITYRTKYTLTLTVSPGEDEIGGFELNGGLVWAPGNLVYDGTWATDGINGTYKFAASQADKGTLWGYGSLQPEAPWTWEPFPYPNISNPGDPCAQVLPKGIWRTPTYQDALSIVHMNSFNGDAVTGNLTTYTARGYEAMHSGTKGVYFGIKVKDVNNPQEGLLDKDGNPVPEPGDQYLFLGYHSGEYWTTTTVNPGQNKNPAAIFIGTWVNKVAPSNAISTLNPIRCVRDK